MTVVCGSAWKNCGQSHITQCIPQNLLYNLARCTAKKRSKSHTQLIDCYLKNSDKGRKMNDLIYLSEVCEQYFGLSERIAQRKASLGLLPIPAFRLSGTRHH